MMSHVPLPSGEREGGALGDGRERGLGLETVHPNAPLPSHGKRRGPLPSPRRGEGARASRPETVRPALGLHCDLFA